MMLVKLLKKEDISINKKNSYQLCLPGISYILASVVYAFKRLYVYSKWCMYQFMNLRFRIRVPSFHVITLNEVNPVFVNENIQLIPY